MRQRRKQKEVSFLLSLFVGLLLAGCSGAELEEGRRDSGLKDVAVNLTLAVSTGASPVTRSVAFTAIGESCIVSDAVGVTTKASNVDDGKISTLWVGQYDTAGNLLIARYLTGISGNRADFQLKESPDCSLRFVANTEDLGTVATLTDFNSKKAAYMATATTCPMLGSLDKQYVSITYTPTVQMTRMCGHIRFVYAIDSKLAFTVKSVSLKNVPTQMQCVEPARQVAGTTYQNLIGSISQTGATIDWYVPENKAGSIASGENGFAATDRQKCGGTSVPNATYMELTGDATVNGTTYKDVAFRLYPGNGTNDYNVKRNTPYVINVTLSGIDLSDPRVSVTVPDIVQPTVMDAAIFSTKSIQATARPGTAWSITLPAWLSAQVGATTANAGGTVNYTGPTPIEFTAATANPGSSPRAQAFTIAGKAVTLTQAGAILTTPVSSTVGVVFNSEATTSFSATKGSLWTVYSATDWVKLTGQASGTLVAASQGIPYQVTTTNPNGAIRTGSIAVKVGNAIDGTDAALLKTIQINQGASSISVPADGGTISKEGGSITVSGIVGTSGLRWTVLPGSTPNGFTTSAINEEAGTFIVSAKQNGAKERISTLTLSVVGANPVREYLIKIKQPINTNNCVPGTTSMMASKALRGNGNYYNAATYCTNLTDVGYDDWRLPAPHELQAIYITKTEIGNITTLSGRFWSSAGNSSFATYVNMDNGGQGNNYLNDSGPNVICVRGTY